MNHIKDIQNLVLQVLHGGDILLIIPSFTSNYSPAIGPHILKGIAAEKGYTVDILYANILLSSIIGLKHAETIGIQKLFHYWDMITERLFARSAYGMPPLGESPELLSDQKFSISGSGISFTRDYEEEELDLSYLRRLEKECMSFVHETVRAIASLDYNIVGCTIRMGQTNCGIALLNGIKKRKPEVCAIIGGTNCLGEMALGIASLSEEIDYIFSGESEYSFSLFLDSYEKKVLPRGRIIRGTPLQDMDRLPLIQYDDFFKQYALFLKNENTPGITGIWYETSRGCWWGEKKKCTFCGLPDELLQFRQKSAEKVLDDLNNLGKQYRNSVVFLSDYIMPKSFLQELVPLLEEKKDVPEIFYYCVKPPLQFKDFIALKKAKINQIQPGMETFSNGILRLLNKGIKGADNLLFLRNARSVGIEILWYMLWGVPGDKVEHYEELLRLLPLIRHFQPPVKFLCILLERFSGYYKNPGEYKIKNIRPWKVYSMIYPGWADIDTLAYYYAGEYSSGAFIKPELIQEITHEVGVWQEEWKKAALNLIFFAGRYFIYDSRIRGKKKQHVLRTYAQVKGVMTPGTYTASKYQKWAVEENLAVIHDSRYVPLITASPDLLQSIEEDL